MKPIQTELSGADPEFEKWGCTLLKKLKTKKKKKKANAMVTKGSSNSTTTKLNTVTTLLELLTVLLEYLNFSYSTAGELGRVGMCPFWIYYWLCN